MYDFNIVHFSVYSTAPNDRQNIDVLANVERIADWVTQQDAAGNYPAFPDGCLRRASALPSNGGYVSAWDEAARSTCYQIRIRYEKESDGKMATWEKTNPCCSSTDDTPSTLKKRAVQSPLTQQPETETQTTLTSARPINLVLQAQHGSETMLKRATNCSRQSTN